MMTLFLTILFILLTGFTGYRFKLLTASGAFAAVMVGFAVYAGFGIQGLFILGLFFATSSFWSKYKSSAKKEMEERLAKGATRDWRQVLANGGTAALLGIVHFYFPAPVWQAAFAAAIASANSDTWASEIGSLSKKDPIDIRTFQRTVRGTSGAISFLGSFAALAGSLFIAVVSGCFFHFSLQDGFLIFVFGFAGNILDTIFGAFYQQKYICKICGMETEKKVHCDQPTFRLKGYRLIDNDMVNFLSGLLSVLLLLSVIKLLK